MPLIIPTSATGSDPRALTETTLDGTTDTFVYNDRKNAVLLLRNPTAGALTPVVDGDGASTVDAPGAGSFDISAGKSLGAIAAGASIAIPLDSIAEYLAGTIAINSGAALIASILEY